ncbi:OmpA family protein [Sphingopyxis sp. MSC1_008]|jgi:outer membrane protein OmpA-like peptidoglycan-associated protein|uniref:hypothetical protein n=1 Tax=Sphingopyxis sp. MSC1_008 TaxID=2909265 RepID=UPI0020BD74AB|nr:hypothetical protein [Sphingopyxis sp. MSC1_008]
MPRFLALLSTVLLVAAPALALQSCKKEPSVAVVPAGSAEDIVVLEDGATIAARKGTQDRAMADWLASAEKSSQSFVLGKRTFIPGTAKLSREGLGDAAMLATLLDATADARVALVGHGEAVAAPSLGQKRAEALATFLEKRGIARDRLAVRPDRGKAEPEAQVTLIAERGNWREPILAGGAASAPET